MENGELDSTTTEELYSRSTLAIILLHQMGDYV